MKKLMLVAVAFVTIAGMTSCKKDYTCTCTYPASSGQTTTASDLGKQSKSDATNACNTLNAAASLSGGSCSIN